MLHDSVLYKFMIDIDLPLPTPENIYMRSVETSLYGTIRQCFRKPDEKSTEWR